MARQMAAACILGAGMALTGCNTVIGAGRDVQAVGGGISHVAREVNNELLGGYGSWNEGVASAGEPCDPAGEELSGASGLPPC